MPSFYGECPLFFLTKPSSSRKSPQKKLEVAPNFSPNLSQISKFVISAMGENLGASVSVCITATAASVDSTARSVTSPKSARPEAARRIWRRKQRRCGNFHGKNGENPKSWDLLGEFVWDFHSNWLEMGKIQRELTGGLNCWKSMWLNHQQINNGNWMGLWNKWWFVDCYDLSDLTRLVGFFSWLSRENHMSCVGGYHEKVVMWSMAQWLQPSPWGIEPVGITGWWFFATPLKNMSESQLGWCNSQYDGKVIKSHGSSHHQPVIINHD